MTSDQETDPTALSREDLQRERDRAHAALTEIVSYIRREVHRSQVAHAALKARFHACSTLPQEAEERVKLGRALARAEGVAHEVANLSALVGAALRHHKVPIL